MNSLVYNCCDGRISDIKALEKSTYMDFCQTLDLFLEKVERRNKEIKKLEEKTAS